MKFTRQELSHCNSVHIKSHANHPDIEPSVYGEMPTKSLLSHGMVMVKLLLVSLALELKHKVSGLQG
jgi:hypothetical protein